ncbi:MAG: cyclic pyranopterin monophosphate synthase MoaC [Verrucomicrobiaceae bacterium]|nr:MAG: cyclic pyranopterin monophosphate synthase MoaC [Verrucomicrobiaceae bacterium]
MSRLSHLDDTGAARMVDVSAKPVMAREAVAEGTVLLQPETLDLIRAGKMPKGEVMATARIAGIQAAKRTADWIPLCHPLPLSGIAVTFSDHPGGLTITATVRTTARTGVEMEALTAVSAAALTLYDMCKAVDKTMSIEGIRLVSKTKAENGG